MPVTITLSEQYGKFNASQILDLPFNVVQKKVSELVVEGKTKAARPSATTLPLVADIDRDIPKSKASNPDAVSVFIGNYRYHSGDVSPVEYALEGAATVREYLKGLFVHKERDILFFESVTKAQFEGFFGTENNQNGKLHNHINPGKSDVFIYYCEPGDHEGQVSSPVKRKYKSIPGVTARSDCQLVSRIEARPFHVLSLKRNRWCGRCQCG